MVLSILDDSSTSEPDTSVTGYVSLTKNGLKLTLDKTDGDKGKYTLKEDPKWTSTTETFSLVATYTSSTGTTTITKVFTVTKNFSGSDISVTPSSYVFNLKSDGTAKNAGDKIKFTAKTASAKLGNSAGTVTWEVWGVKADGTFSPNALVTMIASGDGTYLNVKGTPTDLSVAEMSVTQFKAVCAQASNSYVSARVVCKFDNGAVSDEVTIQTALDGAKGDTGVGVGQFITLGVGSRVDPIDQTLYTGTGTVGGFMPLYLGDLHRTSVEWQKLTTTSSKRIPETRGADSLGSPGTGIATQYDTINYIILRSFSDTGGPQEFPDPTDTAKYGKFKGTMFYIDLAGYYRFDISSTIELMHKKQTLDVMSIQFLIKKWSGATGESITSSGSWYNSIQKSLLLLPSSANNTATYTYEQLSGSKTINLVQGDIITIGAVYKFINTSGITHAASDYGAKIMASSDNVSASGDTIITITKVEKPDMG